MNENMYRLFDEDYLEEHIPEILSLNEYVPAILIGIMHEIYVDPEIFDKWKLSLRNNNELTRFYHRQKSLRQSIAHICIKQNKRYWFDTLIEVLIFLELHPEYYGMIKDEKYLTELVDECEKEYDINVMDYINDYGDLKKLLKKLKGDS